MENLPEVQPDRPLVPPPDGRRDLAIVDGEVYLPQSESFGPDDPKFAGTVADALPEYAASLSDEALHRPRGYSAAAIVMILLFLGGLVAFFFFLRPQVRLEATSIRVPAPDSKSYAGEFSWEYQKAMECIKAERYKEARKTLIPVVDKLLDRGEAGPRNELIFYSYFELCERLGWDGDAERRLTRLIELDDQYRWELFDILRLLTAIHGDNPDKLTRNVTFASLLRVMGRIDRLRRRMADKPELIRMLDLCKCKFGLKLWRLRNRTEPDDEKGLADREEVWQIASQYPRDKEFINVRKYLVNRLKLDNPRGWYVLGGKEYYRNRCLDDILREIDLEAGGGQVRK